MSGDGRSWMNITGISSALVLCGGIVTVGAGFEYFFAVWIVGSFILIAPVSIVAGEYGSMGQVLPRATIHTNRSSAHPGDGRRK